MRRTETVERVLGVDPGTRQTGWGIIDRRGRNLAFCAGGVISTTGFSSLPERLRVVHAGIAEVIEQWTPHTLSLEKAFVAYNVQSAFRLGEARGVILLAAAQAGLRIAEYNPTEIKAAVVGYGRADKTHVQKAVFALLGNTQALPTSPDATDALAAAVCHCHTSPLATQIQTLTGGRGDRDNSFKKKDITITSGRRKSGPRSWRQVSVDSLAPDRVVGGATRGRG